MCDVYVCLEHGRRSAAAGKVGYRVTLLNLLSQFFQQIFASYPPPLFDSFFFFAFYGPFGFPDSVYYRSPAAPTYYVDGLGPYLIQQSKSVNLAQTQNHINVYTHGEETMLTTFREYIFMACIDI